MGMEGPQWASGDHLGENGGEQMGGSWVAVSRIKEPVGEKLYQL